MTESEGGVGTGISRRKAIKLGALGAAGGAAAWLLPGTASGGRKQVAPPGMCARGSGDICGRQIRQCGISKPDGLPNGELCVCASGAGSPAVYCVEDRIDEQQIKCQTRTDCPTGMLCVKRCVDLGLIDSVASAGGTSPQRAKRAQQFEVVMSLCAWPCNQGPSAGEGED